MELFAQNESGQYSTVEDASEIGGIEAISQFFTRDQLVAEIAKIEQEIVEKNLILTMIDAPRFGTVE